MTLQECYEIIGGDYADVMARLPGEKFVQKFVLKFLDDGSYELLERSLSEGNGEDAFRAAHTIKGMCQNLGFTRLGESSSQLTELLRGGTIGGYEALFDAVRQDYALTRGTIQAYKESLT